MLHKPKLWVVLSACADDILLVVLDPGDLAQVEACQVIYLAASFTQVIWIKSFGQMISDGWKVSSVPPVLQATPVEHGPAALSGHRPFYHPSPLTGELT